MSESPNNSGSEGPKQPMPFREYLEVVGERLGSNLLSPENLKRIELVTETLLAAGLVYAVLGLLTPDPELQVAKWAVGVPMALYFAGVMLRGGEKRPGRDSTIFGLALGMTAAMTDGAQETLDLPLHWINNLTYLTLGGVAGWAALVTGRPVFRQLIHPQVPPAK